MAIETILTSEFAVSVIYPFLLIFVLVFAILQKSKILGEGKNQIDALVSLSIALIVVAINWSTNIITGLMPFLAISLVTLLVFMLIYGFVASNKENGLEFPKSVKIIFAVLATIVVVISLIVATGQWGTVYNFIFNSENKGVFFNIIIAVVVIAAIVAVVFSGKKNE